MSPSQFWLDSRPCNTAKRVGWQNLPGIYVEETRVLRILSRNRSRKLLPSWFSRSLVTNVRNSDQPA